MHKPRDIDTARLGREIDGWARSVAPAVKVAVEIDSAFAQELKQRLVDQYVDAHPEDLAAMPSIFRRGVVAILNAFLSEADRRPARHRASRAPTSREGARDA